MEAEEARTRRCIWFGRPCVHPGIEQKMVHGSWREGYVCRDCGSEFSKVSMWENIHHFLQQEMVEQVQQLRPIGM